MKNRSYEMLKIFIACASISLLSAENAFAYLDPGAGSNLLAILMGGASGLLVIWHLFKNKLKLILGLNKKEEDNS